MVLDDNPDYLFFTAMGADISKYKCVRIFYNVENYSPDFNICDYAIGFDEITFNDRYLRYPLYLITDYKYYEGDNYANDFANMQNKTCFSFEDLQFKNNFCGMVVSRAGCTERDLFFEKLCKYKNVLSGGAWKNNIGGERVKDKNQFLSTCKFSIAFENSSTPGYCTEKLMQAFAAKTIPIYFGDPHVSSQFNSESFVNVHEYSSFDEVIKRIKEIDNDDELFVKIMKTPALKEEYRIRKDKELKQFLFNIVHQEPKDALRRHGPVIEIYEQRYAFYVKMWRYKGLLSKYVNRLMFNRK